MNLIGIYGAGGFGREVMPLVRDQCGCENSRIVFIDDDRANGQTILSFEDFLQLEFAKKSVAIAIANSKVRESLSKKCSSSGIDFLSVCARSTEILDNVDIGEGAILCNLSLITSDVIIGRHFHSNYHSYVAHDCVIGDFVTFAPGVRCNGNVHIDDHAYIGSGATIKQGSPGKPLRIGRGAVVGMGAVVTKDVAPGEVVVGNPARVMKRNEP